MTLGSKIEGNTKTYQFELTEDEYNNLVLGKPIKKYVEYSKGRGRFILQYEKEKE